MTKAKPARVQKPRTIGSRYQRFSVDDEFKIVFIDGEKVRFTPGVFTGTEFWNSKKARKVGNWLIKAADYLDARKERG